MEKIVMVDNVPVVDAWSALKTDPEARLVDVRTDVEWVFVGIPDLSSIRQKPALINWQVYPQMQVNPRFVDELRQAGLTPEHHIYFLCRSGARSMAAAIAAREAGYEHVYNIAEGFEGPVDANGHRGVAAGWKAEGLPWQQR
ncbi:Sulfide dehydrogenase precursor [Granulibacter bethesdensis]|nr:Sulfide dehydrogenase precursor [Granulibacter bethesdensis]